LDLEEEFNLPDHIIYSTSVGNLCNEKGIILVSDLRDFLINNFQFVSARKKYV
jgi:hypothetical protein